MLDAAPDPDAWMDELPLRWSAEVVAPLRWEAHADADAHALKRVGRDASGRRCYVQHVHTEVQQRFDIDEFPLEVAVRGERRIAWRLASGLWLLRVDRVERLDSCHPRVDAVLPVLVAEAELGM